MRLLVLALMTSGCATLGGLRTAPLDAGTATIYAEPLVAVEGAARNAVDAAGLDLAEVSQVDSSTWMLLASSGLSFTGGYGALVGVVAQELAPDAVAVRIVTKKRLATDLTARTDWDLDIVSYRNRRLGGKRYAVPSLQIGQVVRVNGATIGANRGRVVLVTDSILSLGTAGTTAQAIRAAAIDSLWVRGQGHAGTGSLVGSVIGLGAGFAIASRCDNSLTGPNCRYVTVALSTAAGAFIGAAIGAAVPHWRLRLP